MDPSMVVLGTRMIYVPIMPGHRKRLPQRYISAFIGLFSIPVILSMAYQEDEPFWGWNSAFCSYVSIKSEYCRYLCSVIWPDFL